MDSKRIYMNLCESRKNRKNDYGPGSGLHAHHIIPRHMGGKDDVSNITYLTVKEHIFAHKLLWKINKNPNDLRAMYMLGANLTSEQRRVTGIFCRDNKIGFFGASPEERKEWRKKGIKSQKNSKSKKSFWWWSTSEGRKKRASMGGKAAQKSKNAWNLSKASEKDKKRIAKIGAKALHSQNRKVMHKPGDKSFIRVLPEEIQNKLNEGYIFGSPIPSPNKGNKNKRVWVYHDEYQKSKNISNLNLNTYLDQGWKKGRKKF